MPSIRSGSEGEPPAKASGAARTPGLTARPDFWLADHIAGLRGRANLSDQQRRFMVLADKVGRSGDEEREFNALASAQRSEEEHGKPPEVNPDTPLAPVDRDDELLRSAELLVLAGLLDGRTGLPVWDRAELLGALLTLAATREDSDARATWKRVGGALLGAAGRRRSRG
ncbi:Conjugal transfer protein TraD (plasmid) [Paraburkholderia kururiensis]|uniref:conjugal transfer protein TraD n=1 Tax=Paraburkholderia kururiensis TaxID=984307 RepID=UPI0039A543CF